MALIKSIPSDYGTDATYWKIVRIDCDTYIQPAGLVDMNGDPIVPAVPKITVFLNGYLDKANRMANSRPLMPKVVYVDTVYSFAEIYALVKLQPYFIGATDDLGE